MKRLIALILLLLAPVAASAQLCGPYQCQYAPTFTSGTVTFTSEAVWNFSTPSFYQTTFTTTGFSVDVSDPTGLGIGHGIGHPIPSGGGFHYSLANSEHFPSDNLSMTLAIDNVLLPAAGADVLLEINGPTGGITHAGTYTALFDFEAIYFRCFFCSGGAWFLEGPRGEASGVIDVVPYPGVPNTFYVDQATFTLHTNDVPEPSTASLLLIGFAGLALLARRRRPEHEI